MLQWIGRAWRRIKTLYIFYLPLRFSALALLVLMFAFWFSDQGRDILRALSEDANDSWVGRFAMLIVATNMLAYGIWYWSRHLLRYRPHARATGDEMRDPETEPLAEDFPRATTWMPRFLGLAVFFIEIFGFIIVRVKGMSRHGWVIVAWLIAFALLYFWTVVKRGRLAGMAATRFHTVNSWRDFDATTRNVLIFTLVAEALLFVWALVDPVSWWVLGVAAVLVLTIAVWIPLGSFVIGLGEFWRFPVIGMLLLVIAPLFSCWNDNHDIRVSGPLPAAPRPALSVAFNAWHDRMRQRPEYANPAVPIPMIIVATEGGGVRAAYWTARVLTRLQDRIPTFADHCFAISGVSGGSLGSTIFDALLVQRAERGNPAGSGLLQDDVHRMLKFDALSGTLAAMAQPDTLQRFLPVPFLPDRANALERGWEHGWSDALQSNMFGAGFLATMQRHPELPALFLNGTMVETGERIITSNVDVRSSLMFRNAYDAFTELQRDIPISTAADMSTRFTYISPAGKIPYTHPDRLKSGCPQPCGEKEKGRNPNEGRKLLGHVIDGGYFENSGAVTASEIVQYAMSSGRNVQPIVVVIDYWARSDQPPTDVRPFCVAPGICGPAAPLEAEHFLDELMSPLRGVFNARGARGIQAVGDLVNSRATVVEFRLVPRTVELPLGWVLSDGAMATIDGAMANEGGNIAGEAVIRHYLDRVSPLPPPSACEYANCGDWTAPKAAQQ
jgi:hypothetical protein